MESLNDWIGTIIENQYFRCCSCTTREFIFIENYFKSFKGINKVCFSHTCLQLSELSIYSLDDNAAEISAEVK